MQIPSDIYKTNNVHYIGHGQLESSPENFSALHVISHELGHVSEFKSEARKLNMDIANIDVHIKYELRNGKLVAVGGETEAIYLPKKENKENKVNDSFESSISISNENVFNKNDEKKEKLQSKLQEIQSDLKSFMYENFLTDLGSFEINDFKNQKRKEELKEVQDKLELEIEALRFEELVQEMKDDLEDILQIQKDFSLNLFKVGAASLLGQNLDLVV